jgi:flagellin
MPLYINTNVPSLEAQRSLASTAATQAISFQRLSSGLRINSAADDAAGLAIAEQLKADLRSYAMAERNTNNAISMVQTGEGALAGISNMLMRMRELAVQSANGDLTSTDRGYIDLEFTALKDEITRIVDSTKFNGTDLLGGTAQTIEFQVGIDATASDRIGINFGGLTISDLGLSATNVAGLTAQAALSAISNVENAISVVSGRRAIFGASLNRMQTTIANLQSLRTNTAAAHGRIRDVDVAEETAALARQQVLLQAGTAVLAQANQAPQLALQLLRG